MAKTVFFDSKEIAEALSKAAALQGAFDVMQEAASDAAILPTADKQKKFSNIRQGVSTNALAKTGAKELCIDTITGSATLSRGSFNLAIPNYTQLAGLKTSTNQLLDALILELTETGAKSPTIILPLEKYMQRRGLSDRKEAKHQAKDDIEILSRITLSWEEKKGSKTESYAFVNIADSGAVKRNGDIVFTLGNTFYNILLGYPVMPYPEQLQTIRAKANPNSYHLLRRIAEHKNMNYGKGNENTISVRTLLKSCPYIPSYADVMKSDKHVDQRIITPFERDMNALSPTLTWEYCHSNNEPLTQAELDNMDYKTFEGLQVHITWINYPNQQQINKLESKAIAIEKAEAKKKRARKKPAKE